MFKAGDMIRVWNEPDVADFNILFYFVWRDRGGPQKPNVLFLDTVQSRDTSGMQNGYQLYVQGRKV